jgi:hypothetical protein
MVLFVWVERFEIEYAGIFGSLFGNVIGELGAGLGRCDADTHR